MREDKVSLFNRTWCRRCWCCPTPAARLRKQQHNKIRTLRTPAHSRASLLVTNYWSVRACCVFMPLSIAPKKVNKKAHFVTAVRSAASTNGRLAPIPRSTYTCYVSTSDLVDYSDNVW